MSTHELVPSDPFVIPDDTSKMAKGQRAQLAFDLRRAGASYELIAEKLGYASPKSAEGAIRNRLKSLYKPDDVEEVVMMELARLDALQLVAWRRAREGDLSAIDRILKIMERRSQYLGLDKKEAVHEGAVTHNTAIFIGGSEEEYVEQLKQAREQATQMINAGVQ
jgi:hypothetical protein